MELSPIHPAALSKGFASRIKTSTAQYRLFIGFGAFTKAAVMLLKYGAVCSFSGRGFVLDYAKRKREAEGSG